MTCGRLYPLSHRHIQLSPVAVHAHVQDVHLRLLYMILPSVSSFLFIIPMLADSSGFYGGSVWLISKLKDDLGLLFHTETCYTCVYNNDTGRYTICIVLSESREYTKDGFALKKQRYKCKKCGCNFTQSHSRFASEETKALALKMYLEGMGFRAIGRVVGFSNVSVLRWIRKFGETVEARVQMGHDASQSV